MARQPFIIHITKIDVRRIVENIGKCPVLPQEFKNLNKNSLE